MSSDKIELYKLVLIWHILSKKIDMDKNFISFVKQGLENNNKKPQRSEKINEINKIYQYLIDNLYPYNLRFICTIIYKLFEFEKLIKPIDNLEYSFIKDAEILEMLQNIQKEAEAEARLRETLELFKTTIREKITSLPGFDDLYAELYNSPSSDCIEVTIFKKRVNINVNCIHLIKEHTFLEFKCTRDSHVDTIIKFFQVMNISDLPDFLTWVRKNKTSLSKLFNSLDNTKRKDFFQTVNDYEIFAFLLTHDNTIDNEYFQDNFLIQYSINLFETLESLIPNIDNYITYDGDYGYA